MTTHWRDILEPEIRGRRFLLALDVLVQATGAARFLHELGAERLFAVGATRGTGRTPDETYCSSIDIGLPPGADLLDGIRRAEASLHALPEPVLEAIDAWDPSREARVVSTIFGDGSDIAGRRQIGGRRPEWVALEDKTVVDAVWDDCGVPRAPVRICPATRFEDALDAVSGPLGAVVAGDSREGFNGAGIYLRWIQDRRDLPEAKAFFAAHCDSVRVMPFLDGLPCSIHGMVFPGCTIGFRPVEMVVLRRPGQSRVQYAGAASYWEAPAPVAREMRAMVERVGEHLRERVDFRGVFTVDGVLTADGFRPTELNPRLGAALPRLFHAIDTHLPLLNRFLVDGAPLDWQPKALQDEVLRTTATARSGGGMIASTRVVGEHEVWVRFTGRGCEVCEEADSEGRLTVGPGPAGSVVFLAPHADKVPIGPSVAPRIAAMAACADALWDLGIGELHPAPEV